MALITWNNNMSVNVKEIDQQHQKLVAMLNELHDAMLQGKAKDVIGSIINGLLSYTTIHFQTEESYFDKYRYFEAGSHKREHADFVRKISDFKNGFEAGRFNLSIEVMQFLTSWLKNHIMVTDKKYTRLFNEKGLR